jgi:hypothetical protein
MDWKVIPDWETYELSDSGSVRRRTNGAALKAPADFHGYHTVHLRHHGKSGYFKVHRLVCMIFIGRQPDADHSHVAHWDGNKSNNHVSNLRWATATENANDKARHGTLLQGEAHGNAKLSDAQAQYVLSVFDGSRGQIKKLASELGVSQAVISGITLRTDWRHIKTDRPSNRRSRSKLTVNDVVAARLHFTQRKSGKRESIMDLAEKFGVGYSTMWNVVHCKSWKDVP